MRHTRLQVRIFPRNKRTTVKLNIDLERTLAIAIFTMNSCVHNRCEPDKADDCGCLVRAKGAARCAVKAMKRLGWAIELKNKRLNKS